MDGWSVAEVATWLRSQKLGELAEIFKAEEVDGYALARLTNEDLLDGLQIKTFGVRKRLLESVKEARQSEVQHTGPDDPASSAVPSLPPESPPSSSVQVAVKDEDQLHPGQEDGSGDDHQVPPNGDSTFATPATTIETPSQTQLPESHYDFAAVSAPTPASSPTHNEDRNSCMSEPFEFSTLADGVGDGVDDTTGETVVKIDTNGTDWLSAMLTVSLPATPMKAPTNAVESRAADNDSADASNATPSGEGKSVALTGSPSSWIKRRNTMGSVRRSTSPSQVNTIAALRAALKERLATPAPGGNVPIPSFAEENKRQRKGVQFGHRLDESKLALKTPAPGGNVEVPSFAKDNQRYGRGVSMGRRTTTIKPLDTPAPGGNVPMPSFAEEAKRMRRGASFTSRPKSWDEIEHALGLPVAPGPGGSCKVPSFAEEAINSRRGPILAPRREEKKLETPAPGGLARIPSFAEDNRRHGKGATFGDKPKDWKEIERRLGVPEPPAPGGNTEVPSFATDNQRSRKGVVFGQRHKTWTEIERAVGIPEPPGPGGDTRVPSFARDNIVSRKGAIFGSSLPPPMAVDEVEYLLLSPVRQRQEQAELQQEVQSSEQPKELRQIKSFSGFPAKLHSPLQTDVGSSPLRRSASAVMPRRQLTRIGSSPGIRRNNPSPSRDLDSALSSPGFRPRNDSCGTQAEGDSVVTMSSDALDSSSIVQPTPAAHDDVTTDTSAGVQPTEEPDEAPQFTTD